MISFQEKVSKRISFLVFYGDNVHPMVKGEVDVILLSAKKVKRILHRQCGEVLIYMTIGLVICPSIILYLRLISIVF